MDRYTRLIERARAGERIFIDGGTGSESLRRGAPVLRHGWSGGAVMTHPDVVREIHRDYIALGADMIASNTFSTGRNILEDAGVPGDFEEVNRRAVELAIEAREQAGEAGAHVVVAAGISNWSFLDAHPPLDVLRDNTVEQAQIMADAGAEFISLEMMVDHDRMTATLDAVSQIGLPVWVGMTIGTEAGHDIDELTDPIELRDGGVLSEGVEIAKGYDCVDAFCIMHTDVRLVESGLRVVREHWDGPLGAYAHAAQEMDDALIFEDVITPAEYAAYEPIWHSVGATMVGGCCGIGPRHVEATYASMRASG